MTVHFWCARIMAVAFHVRSFSPICRVGVARPANLFLRIGAGHRWDALSALPRFLNYRCCVHGCFALLAPDLAVELRARIRSGKPRTQSPKKTPLIALRWPRQNREFLSARPLHGFQALMQFLEAR